MEDLFKDLELPMVSLVIGHTWERIAIKLPGLVLCCFGKCGSRTQISGVCSNALRCGIALRTLLSEVSVFWAAPCLVLRLEKVGFLGGFGLCLLGFLIVVFSGVYEAKRKLRNSPPCCSLDLMVPSQSAFFPLSFKSSLCLFYI